MRKDVLTIAPDTPVQEAVRTMVDNHIGSLVVAKNSIVQGIITEGDVMKALAEGGSIQKEAVSGVMTPYVYTVSPGQRIEEAIKLMRRQKIKKIPVMEGRKLVGIITTTDIVTSQPEMISELRSLMKRK